MNMRFIKWLIVVLIAAAVVVAIYHVLRPDASAAVPGRGVTVAYQNAEMPATPWAPARHAVSRQVSSIPPMA